MFPPHHPVTHKPLSLFTSVFSHKDCWEDSPKKTPTVPPLKSNMDTTQNSPCLKGDTSKNPSFWLGVYAFEGPRISFGPMFRCSKYGELV